jgi:hypothetical protein
MRTVKKYKTNKTNKRNKRNKRNKTVKHSGVKRVYKKTDYSSGDGMLTTVWGPSAWHFIHTVSFNYPNNPTLQQKKQYKNFITNLVHILPCGHCRTNLKNNLKAHPLTMNDMKNRDSYSRYVYNLHEIVNKMLKKRSGLSYCDVRERYEHFRARCTSEKETIFKFNKTKKNKKNKKEKGCTVPLYGKKAKCVLNIVPQEKRCPSIKIDKQCIKRRK